MIEINGLDGVARYFARLSAQTTPTIARALKDISEELVTTHVLPVTPIEFGPLRASARVSNPVLSSGGEVDIEIRFGGPSAGYAIYVHEILRYKHLPPTRAKFLSGTAAEQFPHMMVSLYARTLALYAE